MKRYLILLGAVLFIIAFFYINREPLPQATIEGGQECVDLGLSVKWANYNIGASKPQNNGDFYSWGETEPKEVYNTTNYDWNKKLTEGYDDHKQLAKELDVAAVKWGHGWRMPTRKEKLELYDKCKWVVITFKGKRGYKVIGPNGNYIFLPFTGFKGCSGWKRNDVEIQLWTSTLGKNNTDDMAFTISKFIDEINRGNALKRYCGAPVRAVRARLFHLL